MAASRALSVATVTTVGLLCKGFMNLGFCSRVSVNGMHHLLDALYSNERNNGKGVVTVANHISVYASPFKSIWNDTGHTPSITGWTTR